MNEGDVQYYLGFSYFLGIGPHKFKVLMNQYATIEKAYTAPVQEMQELIGMKTALKFHQFRHTFQPDKKLKELAGKNISVLPRAHSYFPKPLREIDDPPICLYIKGDISAYDFDKELFIGVVGTRKPTAYGLLVAHTFTKDLSISGCVIVSGLALGIDSCAHETALEMGGKTIAILGCGVDIIYPRENSLLYKSILSNGGLIMSEFPPGMTVLPGLFIARNRLISGLSRGLFVVEGLIDSGSLITARYAAQQGKDVFAPPAPITSTLSEAPNLLLKEGAKFVTCVEDILEEYDVTLKSSKNDFRAKLSNEEKLLFDQLVIQPQASDDLVVECKLPIYKVLTLLSSMEIYGVIEKNFEGKYQIKG